LELFTTAGGVEIVDRRPAYSFHLVPIGSYPDQVALRSQSEFECEVAMNVTPIFRATVIVVGIVIFGIPFAEWLRQVQQER
jgi:hypothetical protein